MSGPSPPLARASSFWGRSSTQAQQHSRSQSKILKHMPPSAPCPGPEPKWAKGPPETRSSLELDTELSWISGDLLPMDSQEEAPSARDLKKCYSVEAQSCPRRPASWLDEQRRHSIAVSCLDSGSQPALGPGAASPRQGRWVPHSLRPALRLRRRLKGSPLFRPEGRDGP